MCVIPFAVSVASSAFAPEPANGSADPTPSHNSLIVLFVPSGLAKKSG